MEDILEARTILSRAGEYFSKIIGTLAGYGGYLAGPVDTEEGQQIPQQFSG